MSSSKWNDFSGISLKVLAVVQELAVFEFQALKCSSPQNGNVDGVGHS